MHSEPVIKLTIGKPITATLPHYEGFYRLAACGDKVGLFPQPPSQSARFETRFLVLAEGEVLRHAAKSHGAVVIPFFGLCGVFELY